MPNNELILFSVLTAGFLSFFAPCTFPLIPVYIGMLGDKNNEYKKISIMGRQINIGRFISNDKVVFFAGILVIILGIHQMDIIHIKKLDTLGGFNFNNNKTGALGSYLTGVSFSLGWTPCVTPVLSAVLTLSLGEGRALYGGFLMMIYALGLSVPFIVMMFATDFLMSHFNTLKRHTLLLKRAGGVLVIIMGIMLMGNKLAYITSFIETLKFF